MSGGSVSSNDRIPNTGLSALIFGATGATGSLLLQEILASPHFSLVGEYGRRVTAIEKITHGKEKLEQKVIDFEHLEKGGLKDKKWDVVFIALASSTLTAESPEAFQKVDREYVINVARAARSTHPQRLIYVSAMLANPSSSMMYLRSKGLTELALAQLGYDELIVFRPAFFGEFEREVPRPKEHTMSTIFWVLSIFNSNLYIQHPRLIKALRVVGEKGSRDIPQHMLWKAGLPGAAYLVLPNSSISKIAQRW